MTGTRLLQHQYTSCEYGPTGNAGFQTFAETPGLTRDEHNELISGGAYQPPLDAPPEPTPDEVQTEFPRAFRRITLSSGREAWIYSVYVGRDYSGRFGNYFAHSLVVDGAIDMNGDDAVDAIDAYGWPHWKRPSTQEVREAPKGQLPALSLREVIDRSHFTLPNLQAFLQDKPDGFRSLQFMLQAALCGPDDGRRLLIREQRGMDADAIYWIASIVKCFPPPLRSQLTFSTFQSEPRRALALNVTVGDTDFVFGDQLRRFQFYVFDFVDGQHSDPPESFRLVGEALAGWMQTEPQRIFEFHRFCGAFKGYSTGMHLTHLTNLFLMHERPRPWPGDDLLEMVVFVDEHIRPDQASVAYDRLTPISESLTRIASRSLGTAIEIVARLARLAGVTRRPEDARHVCKSYVAILDGTLAQGEASDALTKLQREIEHTLGDRAKDLAASLIHDERIDALSARLPSLEAKTKSIALATVVSGCRSLGYDRPAEASAVQRLVAEAFKHQEPTEVESHLWIFEGISPDPNEVDVEAMSGISKYIIDIYLKDPFSQSPVAQADRVATTVGKAAHLALTHPDPAATLRARLRFLNAVSDHERFVAIAVGDWKANVRLEDQPDRIVEAQDAYEQHVLPKLDAHKGRVFALVARELVETVPAEVITAIGKSWVVNGRLLEVPDDVRGPILDRIERSLSLGPNENDEDVARRLATMQSEGQVKEMLRVSLREAIGRAIRQSTPDLGRLKTLLQSAEPATYDEAIRIALPNLIFKMDTPHRQEQLFDKLVRYERVEAVIEAVKDAVAGSSAATLDRSEWALLLFTFEFKPDFSKARALKQELLTSLATRLAYLQKRTRERYLDTLEAEVSLTHEANQAINAFKAEVQKNRPTILGRLFGGKRR